MPPPDLAHGLWCLSPREARLLTLRFLDGKSRHECAATLGIPVDALDVALLRAARRLLASTAAAQPARAPAEGRDRAQEEGAETEAAQAMRLALTLDGTAGESNEATDRNAAVKGDLVELTALCRRLQTERSDLAKRLAALDDAEQRSPSGRRRLWLRRFAALVVIALSIYLYFRRAPPESGPPSRPTRDFRR